MKILTFILSVFSACTLAGSFAPMTEEFFISSAENIDAIKPDFVIKSIERGFDDGNLASTSDAGIITLQLKSIPLVSQGYTFEIISGEFEDQLFPKYPITTTKYADNAGSFTFIWLDGSSNSQEPFSISIKISGVSASGAKSEPQFLTISHAGVKKPWWKLW